MKYSDSSRKLHQKYVINSTPKGSEPLLMERILKKDNLPGIYLSANRETQEHFIEACKFLCPSLSVESLPAWDCLPYDRLVPSPGMVARRVKTLTNLSNKFTNTDILVVTVASAFQRVPPKKYFKNRFIEIEVGKNLRLDKLANELVNYGFRNSSMVYEPGDFAIRGGIIDIFPISEDEPVRVDFFGDVIDGIRYFDIGSQVSSKSINKVIITGLMELSLDSLSITTFRKNYRSQFGGINNDDHIYHSVSEGAYLQGLEHLLPLFFNGLETIFDYFSSARVFFEDGVEQLLREYSETIDNQFELRKENSLISGDIKNAVKLLPRKELFLDYEELIKSAKQSILISFEENLNTVEVNSEQSTYHYCRNFTMERKDINSSVIISLRDHLKKIQNYKQVYIICYSKQSLDRLALLLEQAGLNNLTSVVSFNNIKGASKFIFLGICALERGFYGDNFYLISERDIFGDRLVRKSKKISRKSDSLKFSNEITVGELIVHVDHGIGKYLGLEVIDAANSQHECLAIEYLGNDRLLVPISNIELLSRYGSDFATLDRLGSASWQARKAKLAKKIDEIAESLIKVAAKRQLEVVARMSPPVSGWYEFCSEFPFQETVDQEAAIKDVISDFQGGKPVDRLICGDVGFGKTEIALRAAFIAVKNYKQVAVVAPTTILSSQHYKNFLVRFRKTGVKIAQLSRLVSIQENKKIKHGISKGEIDIVIGTHAILESNFSFLDLGLVIIDEEQQFGVIDKEKLKRLSKGVHILSLTATPIPRTLQQAFTGLKKISLIMTPPIDRISVQTYNMAFDKIAIREALQREKSRGGQSFFIVPRVSDIDEIKIFLSQTVEDLSFVVAHGQMSSSILEKNMEGFYVGKFDILIATTIAQSGLDIPRANTIIIYNADFFGLSQLYQLRGRVGRSRIRSYAYFLTNPDRNVSDVAKKRLSLIASLSELGSGFSLASQDLDMRGAGNLLGDEQSGHIKEIGFELYQQMLKDRIDQLTSDNMKDPKVKDIWSPQINIGLSALIPELYIKDLNIRLSVYQRLAAVEDLSGYKDLLDELFDRFGELPNEVYKLVELMKIKGLCKKAGIAKLDSGKRGGVISFLNDKFENPDGLVALIEKNSKSLKVKSGKLVILRDWTIEKIRIKELKYFLEKISTLT